MQLSAYERELMAVVMTVKKWQHYLMMKPFIIKTDQDSFKYVLEQKLSTPFQQKWLSKLAGIDYSIEYKCDSENKVVDDLSRLPSSQLLSLMINSIHSDFSTKIVQTLRDDPNMQQIITELQNDPSSHPQYS